MANEDEKKEDQFDFDSAGEEQGYISLDQARVLAIQHARDNTEFYGSAYASGDLVWEVISQQETEDYYEIKLSYRPAGRFRGEPGVEQFTIDKTGEIELRQILDEPEPEAKKGPPMLLLGAAGLVVIAGIIGIVFAMGDFGGDDATPVPVATTATATTTPSPPTSTPTATPIPDSDGDGLTDTEERRLGTNPLQRDSDVDGLSDYEEVQVGSDPLLQDTDRDGVIDGDDLFPLANAKVSVLITIFEERTPPSPDPFGGVGDPYFIISVNGEKHRSDTYQDAARLRNIGPFIFEVADDIRFVEVEIQAWDEDFDAPDRYDVSSAPGSETTGMSLVAQFDRLSGTIILSGDGAADGGLQGPQAALTVRLESTITSTVKATPSVGVSSVIVSAQDPAGSGNYKFVSNKFTFSVGEKVEFKITAEVEFHTFTVEDLGIDIAIEGGDTETLTFTFDRPGEYKLICIPHQLLGMVGTITVSE